ncbi:LysR family transcriptional regulator [Oxalobacteraceae bacterium OM1]|nr:LysR family transcriptional regulator [Oxalobacteraceae bacterium OM1]
MDHASLEIFCTVAEELSITRAAQRLGRVQSNVTTRIQQLEEELGTVLFERIGKQLRLSPQGDTFLSYARNMLALAEEARQMLRPGKPEGLLRIGSMESTAATRMPAVLSRYHRQWPEVRIELSTAPSRQLVDALRAHRADCALVALRADSKEEAQQELSEMGLAGRPMFREELMLVLPADHPAVRQPDKLAVRSLATFAQGCTYRTFAEDWLRGKLVGGQAEVKLDVQAVGSYHSMLACVASGTCVSFVPRSVLELNPNLTGIRQVPMTKIDTWFLWRAGAETPAVKALHEALAEESAKGRTI